MDLAAVTEGADAEQAEIEGRHRDAVEFLVDGAGDPAIDLADKAQRQMELGRIGPARTGHAGTQGCEGPTDIVGEAYGDEQADHGCALRWNGRFTPRIEPPPPYARHGGRQDQAPRRSETRRFGKGCVSTDRYRWSAD